MDASVRVLAGVVQTFLRTWIAPTTSAFSTHADQACVWRLSADTWPQHGHVRLVFCGGTATNQPPRPPAAMNLLQLAIRSERAATLERLWRVAKRHPDRIAHLPVEVSLDWDAVAAVAMDEPIDLDD